jgi:hypothetical protein
LNLWEMGITNSEGYESVDAPDRYRGLRLAQTIFSTPRRGTTLSPRPVFYSQSGLKFI